MKQINRIVKITVFIVVLLMAFFLSSTIGEFSFDKVEVLSTHEFDMQISTSDTLEALTWNIGYCGLGKEMDYFYDGGRMVMPSRALFDKYLKGILATIEEYNHMDFLLLQEVDIEAKRSYRIPINDTIMSALPPMSSSIGINYAANFIPVPITYPIGSVLSGVNTLSAYLPAATARHTLYTNFKWPKSLFMPNRCFLVNRHTLDNGKEFIMVNAHLSAYDKGDMREKQLHEIIRFAFHEYNQGNYVVVGGDWNQTPPEYKYTHAEASGNFVPKSIPVGAIPRKWQWAYDPERPSNRSLKTAYNQESATTTLDFFMVSPNIEVLQVKTLDLQFAYSDHNPVTIKFRLIDDALVFQSFEFTP